MRRRAWERMHANPSYMMLLMASVAGPERVPDAAFEPSSSTACSLRNGPASRGTPASVSVGDTVSRAELGHGIAYEVVDQGTGDPVLLLHGFPDSAALWRHQIPALADAGDP